MKVKFDGWRYYALRDYETLVPGPKWIPFWNSHQGRIAVEMKKQFGELVPEREYELSGPVYITNCGPKCTGLWPDSSCGHCGGLGVGANYE